MELDRFVFSQLKEGSNESNGPLDLFGGRSFLDVGCGTGQWGMMIRTNCLEDIYSVGIDLGLENLKFCKYHKLYDEVILADVSKMPFRNESFDVAIASEIVEHIPKSSGVRMLFDLENFSKVIIVTTPNGFLKSEQAGLETHVCGWSPNDFKKMGYSVHGIGFKYYRSRRIPFSMGAALFYVLTPVTYVVPSFFSAWLIARKITSKQATKIPRFLRTNLI